MMLVQQEQLERILPTVRKPGRYVGGEYNSIVKDWDGTSTRVCLAFPDIYDLGMSNLGLRILYETVNGMQDVLAERAYLPWVDMIAAMRAQGLPLYSLESRRPLGEFDIIGVSLPYEQLYTNLLEMLDLAGLPHCSADRDERHPLVVAGGHAAFNPEPAAAFVDAFAVGDGEELIVDLLRVYQDVRGREREAQLRALASIPGVYVPRLYECRYLDDGTMGSVEPKVPEAQMPVLKRIVATLPPPPTRLVVPSVDVAHNKAPVEIQRGCTRGCRFCQAGLAMRPVRERPVEQVLQAIQALLPATGFDEVSLLSLSSSDYSAIDTLVREIGRRFAGEHLSISLPSLRADSFSIGLAEAVAQGRHSGFTFAPEAASERLRAVINKPIETEQVLSVAREVFQLGWRTIKLYFMIGLPQEQGEDVAGIVDLARAVRAEGRKVHGRKVQVNVSVNTFVPKPHTPFQWVALENEAEIRGKQALLKRGLRGPGFKLSLSDPQETLLEAALSRGDRRLGSVVHRAWELGARFDAWDEQRDVGAWKSAFEEAGLDPGFYACRERGLDEVFPWEVISTGVARKTLLREYRRSLEAETTRDCRDGCYGCGVLAAYGDAWSTQWSCPPPGQKGDEG
jgi:radical SAM family uncharacterized protein